MRVDRIDGRRGGVWMKLNIMTWNTGITENLNNVEKCRQILNFIVEFLKKENSLVFLQQIVFKDPNNNWEEHRIFTELKEKFNNGYTMKYYKKSTYMMTIAITKTEKNKPLNYLDNGYYPIDTPLNRAIAVEYLGISFLGIHAENGNKNQKYLNSLHGKADIILGDFNAGNYLESENRYTFNQILKEHACICNLPTKETSSRRTCIDHIFVRQDMITKCSNVIVHEEIKLSDHFPVSFEYEK